MKKLVCQTAMCACSFGSAPGPLKSTHPTICGDKKPLLSIMDNKPGINIPIFGMCDSPENPEVEAEKAPQPCTPITNSPWLKPSSKIFIKGVPAITQESMLMCQWMGQIKITNPGNTKVETSG